MNLTKENGWMWGQRFDRYNCYDSICFELHAIISHFTRSQIVNFRDLAFEYICQNKVSWDEAVVLQQFLYWKTPAHISKQNEQIFPLELLKFNSKGQIDFDSSFFELYTLGCVTLKGQRKMKISIFPSEKYIMSCPYIYQSQLKRLKKILITLGASDEQIEIVNKPLYAEKEVSNNFIYYELNQFGGRMNWYEPYRLIMW